MPDVHVLAGAFEAQAEEWERLIGGWDDEALGAPFAYASTDGAAVECLRSRALAQVFTHAAHHRGQITAAFSARRRRFPPLDLQCQDHFYHRP